MCASVQAGWHHDSHGTMVTTMVEKCNWWLILLVYCVWFHIDAIVVAAENSLIGTINSLTTLFWFGQEQKTPTP
jgi:hypothetical protein